MGGGILCGKMNNRNWVDLKMVSQREEREIEQVFKSGQQVQKMVRQDSAETFYGSQEEFAKQNCCQAKVQEVVS